MKQEEKPKEGDLRIYHIPQVGSDGVFCKEVPDVHTAIKMLDILAYYDLRLLELKLRSDFSNCQGLEVFEENEWVEYNDSEGFDINEIRNGLADE